MNEHFSVRAMRPEDLPTVCLNESIDQRYPWPEAHLRSALVGDESCWVATLDEDVVGHGVASSIGDEGELLNVCVAAAHQGKGIGRRLLQAIQNSLKTQGVRSLFLEVRVSNTRACRLYEGLGYFQIGRRRNYYPTATGREDALVLKAELGKE